MSNNLLKCSKCGSNNVVVQVISETKSEKQKHGFWWWLLIGWWLELVLWIFLTVPRLLIALFVPKKQKITTTHKSVAVCQNCGNTFDPQVVLNKTETKSKISPITSEERWYTKTGGIILTLILFFPVGLYLMWKYGKTWAIWVKVIISIFFCQFLIRGFNNKTNQSSQVIPTNNQQIEVKKEVSSESITTSTPTPTYTTQQSQTKEREAFISDCLDGASADTTRELCNCNYDVAKNIWPNKTIIFGQFNEKNLGSSFTKAKLQQYLEKVLSDCGGM